MIEEPSQECDSSLGHKELSRKAVDDQVTSEVLKLVVNAATHGVGAKARYIRLLKNGKWSTDAATASAAGYVEEITQLVPALPSKAGKTMASKAMVTQKPVVVDNVITAELILL